MRGQPTATAVTTAGQAGGTISVKHRLRDAISLLKTNAPDSALEQARAHIAAALEQLDTELVERAVSAAHERRGYDPATGPLLDARGYRRSPATLPGYLSGRAPATKGQKFPPGTIPVEDIVAMLNACPDTPPGRRLHALILVLWRAGLRISEALALTEHDLDRDAGTVFVRCGKGGKSGTVGIDDWVWPLLDPWLETRREMPVGPLFCVIQGPSAGRRAWGYPSARRSLAALGACAGVRRRVNPHSFRHTFAVEIMTEGHPMVVLQRSLRHASLQVTTIYLQAFPNQQVIEAIRGRPMPTLPVFR